MSGLIATALLLGTWTALDTSFLDLTSWEEVLKLVECFVNVLNDLCLRGRWVHGRVIWIHHLDLNLTSIDASACCDLTVWTQKILL